MTADVWKTWPMNAGVGVCDSCKTPIRIPPGGPETAAVPSGPPESQCLLLPSD